MSKRDTKLLLLDIKESAEKILRYTADLESSDFKNDDKTIDAVVRNFQIIGEASIRIEEEFKRSHPEIQWKKLRGFRNRIVHEYFGIDLEILWNIIKHDLEELRLQIDRVMTE